MLSTKVKGTLAGAILATGLAVSATTAEAANFAVNNTNSSGAGSLRSAINAAEGTAAADTITFSIPGAGPHTITPATPLPTITRPLKIRGYSEPGATAATANSSAVIMIVIDAVNVARGLDIGGDDIEVRGLNIQRAQGTGVFVEGRDNVVAGNFIGTGVAGLVARPNGDYGVEVHGQDNLIGGILPEERNVISGNGLAEVYLDNGSGHVVQGNRIGIGAGGANDLGNQTGVLVESDGNEILDNLISGELNGVNVYSDENVLQGNLIGTNAAGDAEVGNFVGVNVIGGDGNQIGGTGEGEGNVISGNEASGLQLILDLDDPAENNKVEGNLIGVTSAGNARLGNGSFGPTPGVVISGSASNTIGGSVVGAGNVIAANGGDGIRMLVDGADDNSVYGNWIGTDAGATLDLGNGGSGVDIEGDDNRVGDPDEEAPKNTIAHNGDDGVTVTSGTDNAILRNSIFANDELGDRPGRQRRDRERPGGCGCGSEQPPERPGDRQRDGHDRRLGARERSEHALPARVLRQRHLRPLGQRGGPDVPRRDVRHHQRQRRRRRQHGHSDGRRSGQARLDDRDPDRAPGRWRLPAGVRLRPPLDLRALALRADGLSARLNRRSRTSATS